MFSLSRKPVLDIIHEAIVASDDLPIIELAVERFTLVKRRWRATAIDGREFGFDLEQALRHGDVFFQTAAHRYQIAQLAENVLRLRLSSPAQAARVAWQAGNLHFRVMIEEDFLLVEDDLALRQMLEREGFSYTPTRAIFEPLAGAAGHPHHPH